MPVVNRIADYAPQMTEWRRYLHTIPELGNDCFKTAAFVAERLRDFGVDELHEGFATTGIVAIINGQAEGPTIGLRADMDALPIPEETGLDYASTHAGKMHACGHDGHTTMLLGAAKYLAETRNFAGRVALIFQPAEETGGGAEVMVEEGILDRFDMSLGTGLGKVKDKVFRIGHLGNFNDLMLAGTLSGVEMGLGLAGVPHAKGGLDAALEYLATPDAAEGVGSQPARASA